MAVDEQRAVARECSGMSLEGGGGLGRRHRARRDRDQVGDDFIEWSVGIQLMRAALPEERLNPGEVIQDHRSFHCSLPVAVRRSARDPVKDHVSRSAEQDDRVETVVELRLVPHAPLNEERATIIGVQQPGDPFLDPEPLPAAHLVGGLNILAILAPARIIGVYDAIPRRPSSASADDLPVPDMPVTKILDIGTTLPSIKPRRGRVPSWAPRHAETTHSGDIPEYWPSTAACYITRA